MARIYRLVFLVVAALAASAAQASVYNIVSATAFSPQAIPPGTFPTAGDAAAQYVTNANNIITNQGNCTGPKSVTLVSAPTPPSGGDATGSISYSWTGRENGNPVGACIPFSSSGTFVIHASVNTAADDYCQAGTGSNYGDRVVSVTSITGKLGTTATGCSGDLGPLPGGGYTKCTWSGTITACGGSGADSYCWVDTSKGTGTVCGDTTKTDPGDPVTGNPATDPPPKGLCPAEFNGQIMWLPCGTNSESTPSSGTSTTSNPDGTTKTESVTADKQTTCTNGVCTTTTVTSTTVNGSTTTSTSTQTKAQSEFCAANPTATACKDGKSGGALGGNCASGYTATGEDALLGAAAVKLAEIKCAFFDKTSDEATAYAAAKAASSATGLGSTTTAISGSSFDQTNALGQAACVPNKTITIAGAGFSKTLELPFSVLCPYLDQLGSLLVAVSMLAAMFIVFRR